MSGQWDRLIHRLVGRLILLITDEMHGRGVERHPDSPPFPVLTKMACPQRPSYATAEIDTSVDELLVRIEARSATMGYQ